MSGKDLDFIKECVAKYRDKLLDTSKRNILISFRHSERSRQHVRIIDELPDFLYGELADGKTLAFLPLPEEGSDPFPRDEKTPDFRRRLEQARLTDEDYKKAVDSIGEDDNSTLTKVRQIDRALRNKIRKELGLPEWKEQKTLSNAEIARRHNLNPNYEMPAPASNDQESAKRHTDKYIQTLLKSDELDRKLSGLNSYIRSDIEESGVNTLHVAFGFLEWYEAANSDKACFAPLLLLQLEIEKQRTRKEYLYRVRATGNEVQINLSISKRLRKDFGIELPEFTEKDTPETYMLKVSKLIKEAKAPIPKREEWRVRRFVTIGRFSFARLAMYDDLDENKWPSGAGISAHEIVKKLFVGSDNKPQGIDAPDYDIDAQEVTKAFPLLIAPADASQHSALIDVMQGKNIAIKGPPGTGKSQTITNVIANALSEGKTVLFLAEKMAALNVVYERLRKANLEPYCLELHSTKAKKTEILKSIKARLELSPSEGNSDQIQSKIQEFKKYQNIIKTYIDVLNSDFGRRKKTVHAYLWSAQLRKEMAGNLPSVIQHIKIPFKQADLTESELTRHTDDLKAIVARKQDVDKESDNGKHPWGFVSAPSLDPFQQEELKQAISRWADQIQSVQENSDGFTERFNLSIAPNATALRSFLDDTEKLVSGWTTNDLNQTLIAALDTMKKTKALLGFVEDVKAYERRREEITAFENVPNAISQIREIERYIATAKELDAGDMAIADIQDEIRTLKKELDLCHESLERLSAHFDISENDSINRIHTLIEVIGLVDSVPRNYLLTKTKDIIDERNHGLLKMAADTQKVFRVQETKFYLSLMERPSEIRRYAVTLAKAGLFAFLFPSYWQARNFYLASSKHMQQFRAHQAAATLSEIADAVEKRQEMKRDSRLQAVCGSSWNGFDTDFEELQKINEWASQVRKHSVAGDEFICHVCQRILNDDGMEELDPARELANDNMVVALKDRIADIKNRKASMGEYFDGLRNRIEKLGQLQASLQNITFNDGINFAGITEDLPRLHKAAEVIANVEKNQNAVESIFGESYAGVETDIKDVVRTTQFISDFLATPALKSSFEIFLNENFSKHWHAFLEFRGRLKKQHEAVKNCATQTQEHSQINLSPVLGIEDWEDIPYASLISLFRTAMDKPDTLDHWVDLSTRLNNASQDIKDKLLAIYDEKKIGFDTIPLAFEHMIYRSIAREIYRRNPGLKVVRGLDLQQSRARIRELDQEIVELQQMHLRNELNKAKPYIGNSKGRRRTWTEDHLLNNEINKQRRHIPIRDLMERAGASIQNIKPCFLMSPFTVAQYLEPSKFNFDLVIIDEASQMRPEEALGGIARAKQIVVVGDQQQLPPTSFFQESEDGRDEEEDFTSEAIMDMALSSFRPSRILSRHYRSQHEGLIAFSNYHFYDESLVLFPSPVKNPNDLGVQLKYIGGTYTAQSNRKEVESIVKESLDFMRKYPDRSLGIATLNQVQRDLIESEMNQAFIDHPHAAEYKEKWHNTLEAFFVKSLENVQGDERDAIFISTVYGPDESGTVMQRFGPINQKSGHRRLNVLFTRAKKNMVVFTSLRSNDIKISHRSSRGLKALRDFLAYAATGAIDSGQPKSNKPESDFEIYVKEKLESIGCEVDPQVGVAGYRIDLGVKHQKHPDGYLLGVECDGATYHSSKSARERDVIRQQFLEGLGWHIYRIWSTDWFLSPVKEFEKLKNHIEALLNNENPEAETPDADDATIEQDFIEEETDWPEEASYQSELDI